MRKALTILLLTLLLFSCSKEEFTVSSLSLRAESSITIEDGRVRNASSIVLSAALSDEDAVYTFRIVSPDGDLVWSGPFDGSGVRRVELELTPGASFPEGQYSIVIYSDKGTDYSGTLEYRTEAEYPYYGPDGLTMDAYTVEYDANGLIVGKGLRSRGYKPTAYAVRSEIEREDRYGNSLEIHDDLSLSVPQEAEDPSQTAL